MFHLQGNTLSRPLGSATPEERGKEGRRKGREGRRNGREGEDK